MGKKPQTALGSALRVLKTLDSAMTGYTRVRDGVVAVASSPEVKTIISRGVGEILAPAVEAVGNVRGASSFSGEDEEEDDEDDEDELPKSNIDPGVALEPAKMNHYICANLSCGRHIYRENLAKLRCGGCGGRRFFQAIGHVVPGKMPGKSR